MTEAKAPKAPASKASRNEGYKLLAGTFNTIGLAGFALGVLTPVFSGVFTSATGLRMLAGVAILIGFHLVGHLFLRFVKD